MLIFTTRFSKKKAVLIVVALGLAMAALIFLIGRKPAEDPAPPQLVTNEDRVAYLQSLGWEVSPEPVRIMGGCICLEVRDRADLAGYQEFAVKRGVFARPFLNCLYAMPPYVIGEGELVQVLSVMKDWFT